MLLRPLILLVILPIQSVYATSLEKKIAAITTCIELGVEVAKTQTRIDESLTLKAKLGLIYQLTNALPRETVPYHGNTQSFTQVLETTQNRLKLIESSLKHPTFDPKKYVNVFAQSELFDIKQYNDSSFRPNLYFVFFMDPRKIDDVMRGPVQTVEHDANHGVFFQKYLRWLFDVPNEQAYLERIKKLESFVPLVLNQGRAKFNQSDSDMFFDAIWFVLTHEKNFLALKVKKGPLKGKSVSLLDKRFWGEHVKRQSDNSLLRDIHHSLRVLGYEHLLTRSNDVDSQILETIKFIRDKVLEASEL